MNDRNPLLRPTVDLLRDVTRNREVLMNVTVEDLPRGEHPDAETALDVAAEASYGVVHAMEDAALFALLRLYLPACDYGAVTEAIERANADWLYEVMLTRAVATVKPNSGDS